MIKIGIVGGTGYTGAELLRLALAHPNLEVECVTSRREAGQPMGKQWPQLAGREDLLFVAPDLERLIACDLVFFATPNGTAMKMSGALLDVGVRVIDLSADFRLRSIPEWEQWYGVRHESPELLSEAVYGLPEVNREQIKQARLIACPGCYPTAVLLGLLPLVESGLVEPGSLIADAKSGVSGAGRKLALGTLYGEVADNFKAYGVNGHRHLPEIEQLLNENSDESVSVTFQPHLLPMFRGLQATLYATTRDRGEISTELYRARYETHPFVHVHDWSETPETRSVRGTNVCRIAVNPGHNGKRVIVISVIDNLVKGAAGQAIQNANLMFGFPETQGLPTEPFFP
jgi:N-acetyl-gamma-glutamyl-phosphate reductase